MYSSEMSEPVHQTVDSVLRKIKSLPILPGILSRGLKLINDPQTSAKELTKLIELDPSLTSGLLRIVNSAFYGFSRKIVSVNDAVVILGFNAVKSMFLTSSVISYFKKVPFKNLNKQMFWKHSFLCAIISKKIAELTDYNDVNQMFTAGLLHDIGRIIFDWKFQDQFAEIVNLIEEKQMDYCDAEIMVMSINHAEIGAMLLQQWQFPETLVTAVRYHHCDTFTDKIEVEILRAANDISKLPIQDYKNNMDDAIEFINHGDLIPTELLRNAISSLPKLAKMTEEMWESFVA